MYKTETSVEPHVIRNNISGGINHPSAAAQTVVEIYSLSTNVWRTGRTHFLKQEP
jgi:hypothetical protein